MPDFFYRTKINPKKITILPQIFNHFSAFIAEDRSCYDEHSLNAVGHTCHYLLAANVKSDTLLHHDHLMSVTKAKTTNTSQPVANKRLSALDAAVKVLAKATDPMNCRQLIETMTEKDYWQPKHAGKTPQNTLHTAISKEIKTKGSDTGKKLHNFGDC
jgi:hypothetical protein